MAEVLEYAARLSQAIGARPAGTEEEQQASFFIEETFQQAGLDTQIEEFNCNPNYELPRVICCIAAIALAILTIFLQVLVIPVFIVTLVLAVLFSLEVIGSSPFAKTAKRGISQNVVARYVPGAEANAASGGDDFLLDGGADPSALLSGLDSGPAGQRSRGGRGGRASARKRKIVLIARYDSGKVRPELKAPFLKVLDYFPWIEIGSFALIPLALLVRMIFDAQGPLLVVLNTVIVICAIVVFIPVVVFLMHRTAPWSDGANNNASGTAVMLEVAQRIAKSAKALPEAAAGELPHRVSDADDLVVMHGEDALVESGMLPVDTDLIYDEAANGEISQGQLASEANAALALGREMVEADGQDAAGAAAGARAAGEARDAITIPVGEEPAPAPARSGAMAASQSPRAAAAASPASVAAAAGVAQVGSSAQAGGKSSVPDWFKKGIEAANANKEAQELDKNTPIVRSRFSDALDAARETSAGSIEEFAAREHAAAAAGAQDGADGDGGFVSPWSPAATGASARRASAGAPASSGSAAQAAPVAQAPAGRDATAAPSSAAAAQRAAEAVGSQATGEITLAAAAAIEEAQAQEAAQLAQSAEEVAEQAATADRTISFIPVAADMPAEMSATEVVESVDAAQADLLAKTPEEILAEASSAANMSGNPREAARESAKDAKRQRRTIALPSLTGAIEAVSTNKQAAPLADDAERTPGDARAVAAKPAARVSIPALGAEEAASAELEAEPAAFATSSFEPVGDDLMASMEQDDIVIEDVDDSDYETNTTPTGAIAGPGYVEMPKSRVSRLRGIFGRKKKTEETSFVEAVGLAEDFDARKVGADRGGWESFQNESADWDSQSGARTGVDGGSDQGAGERTKRTAAAPTARTASSKKSQQASRASAGRNAGAQAGRQARQAGATSAGAAAPASAKATARSTASPAASATRSSSSRKAATAATAGTSATKAASSAATAAGSRTTAASGTAQRSSAASASQASAGAAAAAPSKATQTQASGSRTARSGRGAHSRSLEEMRAEEEAPRTRKAKSSWDDWDEYDDWNGGGFSLSRIGDAVKGVAKGKQDDPAADDAADDRAEGAREGRSTRATDGRQRRKNPGDLLASLAQDAADEANASESAYAVTAGSTGRSSRSARGAVDAETMIDEREQIRSFRSGAAALTSFEDVAAFAGSLSASSADEAAPAAQEAEGDMHDLAQPQGFQTEVWFVALGAELADNAGIKAFLAEHGSELRGAIVIDIEALGAGTLSLIESEGAIRPVKASSRMKRYVAKAGSALGMRIGSEKMNWCESAAYCAARKGLQTIHVAGMLNGKPAYMAEVDDRIDNIDEDKLLENAAFVLELLHNI